MGSRAVVLVCRDDGAPARFGVGRARRDLHPHRPAVLRRTLDASCCAGCARRSPRPGSSTSWTPTGCCSTPSCCRGRPRPTGLIREQYASGRRGRAGRAAGRARPCSTRPPRRGPRRRRRCATGRPARLDDAAGSPTPTARYCWPTDGLDGVRLAPFAVLAVGRRQPRRPRPRLAPGARRPAGRRRPGPVHPDPPAGRRPGRRRGRGRGDRGGGWSSPRPAARAWWSSRTPGLVPDGEGAPGPAGPQVPRPGVPADHLRPGLHRARPARPAARARRSAASAAWRCASTRSAWRRWTGWPPASRCGASTRRSSPSWPASPSRSTRACDGRHRRRLDRRGMPGSTGTLVRRGDRCCHPRLR